MKTLPLFISTFWASVCCCMSNSGLETLGASEQNVDNLSRVEKGMSEKEVLQIMQKPYSSETIQLDKDTYDIWFYITNPTTLDQSTLVPYNLTPLTFKNGQLVSIGYDYYNDLVNRTKPPQAAPAPQAPKQQRPPEEEGLEKALKPPAKPVSMSKVVDSQDKELPQPKPEEQESEPKKQEPCCKEKPEDNSKKKLDEQDEQMLDEESDQNFNFW